MALKENFDARTGIRTQNPVREHAFQACALPDSAILARDDCSAVSVLTLSVPASSPDEPVGDPPDHDADRDRHAGDDAEARKALPGEQVRPVSTRKTSDHTPPQASASHRGSIGPVTGGPGTRRRLGVRLGGASVLVGHSTVATASISTSNPAGRSATATALRAGDPSSKNSA